MTDSFEARGDSLAEATTDTMNDIISDSDIHVLADVSDAPAAGETSLDAIAPEPNGFVKLGLARELLQAVADMGFTQPTAVQMATIPKAMQALDQDVKADPKAKFTDLLVSSQTGSGKTAAFLLPVLHTLLKQQEEAERTERAEFERLSAEAVARGEPPLKKPKRKDPTNARNFKAATPGALILCPTRELAQQVCADAIDLVRHCERKQTMMFSATFAPRIMQLATRVMRQPQRVEIDSPHEKHASITQSLLWADNMAHKRKLLDHSLRDTTMNQSIVFACTQVECDGLANDLVQEGFSAVALHGALGQGLRNRRLMAFRDGRVQILVATDVAARGLDVPSITHVINYGLPMKAEDYVHRIGRTGRAGREGKAITIAEFRDRRKIQDIEHYTQQNLKPSVIAGLEPQQRFAPTSERPRGNFGGDRGPRSFGGGGVGRFSNDRAPSGGFGGGAGGGYAGKKPAFGDRGGDRGGFGGNRDDRGGAPFQGRPAPQGNNYADRSGFNDRGPRRDDRGFGGGNGNSGGFAQRDDRGGFGGGRSEGFASAPRGDFADRKPAFAKPAGKVFVPRDAHKRPTRPAR